METFVRTLNGWCFDPDFESLRQGDEGQVVRAGMTEAGSLTFERSCNEKFAVRFESRIPKKNPSVNRPPDMLLI